MCNDIPKENLTIEVEFNENSSPFHKSDDEMTHKLYCKDSLIQLQEVERNGFTKYHRGTFESMVRFTF